MRTIKHLAITAAVAASAVTAARALADCDCGRTDPSNPCTGNTVTRVIGGHAITFEFNADGEDCRCGRFVNGEAWVVPVTASGRRVGGVTVTAISPDGENNAAESNPDSEDAHGVLPRWGSYDAARNVMTQLPYLARAGESIIKSVEKLPSSTCGTGATQQSGCIGAFDVLTVLDSVPPDNGSTVFRPPYAGTDKPLRSIHNVRFDRLPRIERISSHPYRTAFSGIVGRWNSPQYELTHAKGEMMRGTTPMDVLGNDYAANTAATYLGDLLSVFGTETDAEKAAAVYALMQPGFDNYAIYRMGIPFHSGAGQHLGKKPQIVFAAAMYGDEEMIDTIRGAAVRTDQSWFQEDEQIFTVPGQSTTPVWGNRDDGTVASGSANWYWHTVYLRWANGADTKKTLGDWHGYIDGPGGGADNASYQFCCSTGPFAAFVLAMHLMPWMEYANNDQEIITYIDRVWNGRGIDGFDGGWWGSPDPCAPVDSTESDGCNAHQDGVGCLHYKETWGPDPDNTSDCVKHGGDPTADGRYSALHGKYVSPATWGRLPKIALTSWTLYRDCADSTHASYPCAGMGPEVNAATGAVRPAPWPVPIPAVTVRPSPVRGTAVFTVMNAPAGRSTVISMYGHNGTRLIRQLDAGVPGIITWDGTDEAGVEVAPGMYYYVMENAAGSTVTGRLMKVND